MSDVVNVALIAIACSGVVGLAGLAALTALRRASMRVTLTAVAAVTVAAMVAGVVGTAQAMFLDAHDLGVVIEVSLVAGVVALAVALLLGHRVVKGSQALARSARTLGDIGGFAPAYPPTAELAALSRELAAANQRLAKSRDRERALEASRRELVAWVSHDLRTPLAGMRAMAEALEDGLAADPMRYHRQIRLEVDRLAAMVDDLFELSRIHAGTLQLSLAQVRLGDLVSDALAGADALARARGVTLSGDAFGSDDRDDSAPLVVRADSRELSRVLTNLVVNAIRHTPGDGSVSVRARSAGEHAILEVTDGCGGIPAGDLDRVFDVGWRGTGARTPGPDGGAGLGLAIARGIVEAHHGRISVENTAHGCRFAVMLPRGPHQP